MDSTELILLLVAFVISAIGSLVVINLPQQGIKTKILLTMTGALVTIGALWFIAQLLQAAAPL
jgi:hypothetical protein